MSQGHISYPSFCCRVPTGLEDVSKYVDLFSALYASGKWSIQVKDVYGIFKLLNNFLGIETTGWIKLFKSLEGSGESKFEDL